MASSKIERTRDIIIDAIEDLARDSSVSTDDYVQFLEDLLDDVQSRYDGGKEDLKARGKKT